MHDEVRRATLGRDLAPMMSRRAAILLCVVLGLGCAPGKEAWSSSDTGFPLAYFHDDCAPWDGYALTIVLSHAELENPFEEGFPSVRVTSYRPPSQLDGQLHLEFEGGEVVSGAFEAVRLPLQMLCG